ncbi:MAG: phospholipase [Burkholderiales bacterium]|nr:MAG: phospholipase [Burkholderiales bacterium]
MKPFLTRIAAASVALLSSLLVAGCGGGATADTTPAVKISSVKVFGDSLQDSGTFGYKFTVQSPDNLIYAERIAANYGQTLCNFYVFTGTTFAANTAKAGCTNFAIGGGRITYTGAGASAQNPLNVGVQMATYASIGSYSASDLVIVDGGGNDAADLVGAYLSIVPGNAASTAQFAGLLGTLLSQAQIGAALQGGQSTINQIGATYMTALADKFAGQIKASVLDKGATRVVVLNIPDITFTPRFQTVLDAVAVKTGGGAAIRAQLQALFQSWISAYNTQLATKFAGNDSVVLIDFYKAFQDQVAAPAQYGLTNVKTPACPIKGLGSDGLPTYDFPTCTATALSAAPPAGVSGGADWWKSYAFSDSFHPTLYGHQLTQQLIAKSLATKGWL